MSLSKNNTTSESQNLTLPRMSRADHFLFLPHTKLGSDPTMKPGPSNPRILESSNPPILEPSNPQIIESSNPRILDSSNPQILESLNPRILESSNHRIIESLNPRGLESSNPRFLESLNPRVLEFSSPWILKSSNARILESSNPSRTFFISSSNPSRTFLPRIRAEKQWTKCLKYGDLGGKRILASKKRNMQQTWKSLFQRKSAIFDFLSSSTGMPGLPKAPRTHFRDTSQNSKISVSTERSDFAIILGCEAGMSGVPKVPRAYFRDAS
jgi:hypothetical protein